MVKSVTCNAANTVWFAPLGEQTKEKGYNSNDEFPKRPKGAPGAKKKSPETNSTPDEAPWEIPLTAVIVRTFKQPNDTRRSKLPLSDTRGAVVPSVDMTTATTP
jgi:hypothetical protein